MDVSILNPNKISESKHQLVRGVIIKLFQEGKLEFDSFLKYFGETVENDPETALIIVYYANNTMKNNPDITKEHRDDVVRSMLLDLNKVHKIDYNKYV